MNRGILYVVVTAAGVVSKVPGQLLPLAAERGWDVHVLATERAFTVFPETMAEIADVTGHPVRTDFHTTVGYSLPDPDAVVVAPATFNTVTKWALGLADSYVLTRLAEQTGRGVPVAVAPYVNTSFAQHPTYERSLATLTAWGVRVVIGPGEPHTPGATVVADFPSAQVLDAVTRPRG